MKRAMIAAALFAVGAFFTTSSAQTTERIDVDSAGNQDHGGNYESAMSADGRYVAFMSGAADLVHDGLQGGDIFLRDRLLATTIRIGHAQPIQFGSYVCASPAVSADGRYIAYTKNLDFMGSGSFQAFLYDRATATTTTPSGSSMSLNGNSGVVISGDGRYLAWEVSVTQIYLHDLPTGTNTQQTLNANNQPANGASVPMGLSFDGRYLVFRSFASNLVAGDTNAVQDVFVRDTVAGTIERVSVDSLGAQGDGDSGIGSISADGRFVAFDSASTNLVAGDTNGERDVFLRDRATGVTTRISVGLQGQETNDYSENPVISADGRFVAFDSVATNLVPGDTNGKPDVFVYDALTGAITRASVDASGTQGNDYSFVPVISSDGARIVFQSNATNLVPGDTNNWSDIFVRDLAPGCPLAAPYCTAATNSTGSAAAISSTGWASLSTNNLVLASTGLPATTNGIFFFGTSAIDPGIPFGNGVRCVGGPLVRLGVTTAHGGAVSQSQDLSTAPYTGLQPGDTRYFEFWYRDAAAGGANFNASNGLTLTFVN